MNSQDARNYEQRARLANNPDEARKFWELAAAAWREAGYEDKAEACQVQADKCE